MEIQVPLTIVQANISVPLTQDAPTYLREADGEPDSKVGSLPTADDLDNTDALLVVRPGQWSKKTTIQALAAFLSLAAGGAALLQEDANAEPARISELLQAQKLSDEDATAVVQAGATRRMRMRQIADYMQQAAENGWFRTPAGLTYGFGLAGSVIDANTVAIQTLADEMSPDNGGQGGIIYLPGWLQFDAIRHHPAVHFSGDGRYSSRWMPKDNCSLTTGTRRVNGVVTVDAPAEARALFYCLARAPYVIGQLLPTPATQSWVTNYFNFTITGNKANQSGNWVAGLYAESGDSDPHFDDVAPGGDAKAYSGFNTFNVEVEGFSGTGIYLAPERQRSYIQDTRSLNNGIVSGSTVVTLANGIMIKGVDSIIGPRCGMGGNTDIAVEFSGVSGVNIVQGNFWNGHLASVNAATCVQVTGCNGVCIHGNTFNGNVHANAGASAGALRKPVVIVANETRWADELFPDTQANGQPLGITDGAWRNAAYTISGYRQFLVDNNSVAVCNNGKTALKLLWARTSSGNAAKGSARFTVSTETGVKPWADADDLAFQIDSGSTVLTELTDVNTGRVYRNGGLITAQGVGYHRVDGAFALRRGVYAMVSGQNLTLAGEAMAKLSAGDTIDALPLFMPAPRCQDQRVEVLFRTAVRVLTVGITPGQQDTPTDGGALQNVLFDSTGLPPAIDANTTVLFHYDRTTTTWSVAGVWSRYDTANVKDPVRDLGAKLDGNTVITTQYQASVNAAKQAAVGGYNYGLGGTVRGQVGVAQCGPLTWSRWVSFEGIGALGSHTIRSDYSARAGVPGTDAQITMNDDGSGQAGIVGQQRFHNLAMDGRRSSLVGGPLATHVRHGLLFPDPTDGTDRVCSVGDLQIMNYPGDGWQVTNNDQVRGGNIKLTGNKRNINWSKVKDGKVDQLGSGSADQGNLFSDCASLKFGKVDFWTGSNSDGSPLCTWASCAKLVIGEGEAEGMWVFIGDNNLTNSKSYRTVLMNTCQSINFKVSEDYFASPAGAATNITTGAGYVAHVKVVDHFGLRLPNCSFGYKLGDTPTPGQLAATPPFAIWFGTQVSTGDPNYASFLDQCGYVDVSTTAFLWHDGKNVSGVPSKPICAYKLAPSNMMKHLHGYRVGTITERLIGTQHSDEVECDGGEYTSDYYPLLYIAVTGGVLTDRDATGGGASGPNGYKTFNVPNLPTGNGITKKYICFKQ